MLKTDLPLVDMNEFPKDPASAVQDLGVKLSVPNITIYARKE